MQKLSSLFFAYLPIRDFLYILQLEEYDHARAASQFSQRLFRRNFEKRGKLEWTFRALITAFLFILTLLTLALLALLAHPYALVLFLLLVPILSPFLLLCVSVLASPLVQMARSRTLRRAKRSFAKRYSNTKIIAITGSYGKTTTKYLLYDLLKYSYAVAYIPQNINTSLGVAKYLLQGELPPKLDLLIVEMGAYTKGDIAQMCHILPPDIAVLTKLGDQHLERFGSFENLVHAKYEIFAHAKQHATRFTTNETLQILNSFGLSTHDVVSATQLTGPKANVELAAAVASFLKVSDAFIADALSKFKPVERRNDVYQIHGITVFDNSYNLSLQTAASILKETHTAAQELQRDLVVMTAGISEQGAHSLQANEDFATLLNTHAKRAIIHPSIFAQFITQKLTIPFVIVEFASTVLTDLPQYVDADTEVLLHLPEQTDLSYL